MSDSVLHTEGLVKRFGRIAAVQDLNLDVKRGQVFGLLGPNGSGKTTSLGLVLGILRPNAGRFTWFGQSPDHTIRKHIGAILERPVFYPYMSGKDNLELVCMIKGVSKEVIPEMLELVSLQDRASDPFRAYSLGMKQRLAIASALLSDPDVLILDEPTNGLDPQGITHVRSLIRKIGSTGKTIILASHLLDEVQKVCSDFAVLDQGKLVYTGNVAADLSVDAHIEIGAADQEKLRDALGRISGIRSLHEENGIFVLQFESGTDALSLNTQLVERGIILNHLRTRRKSLEEQFLEILSKNHEETPAD